MQQISVSCEDFPTKCIEAHAVCCSCCAMRPDSTRGRGEDLRSQLVVVWQTRLELSRGEDLRSQLVVVHFDQACQSWHANSWCHEFSCCMDGTGASE